MRELNAKDANSMVEKIYENKEKSYIYVYDEYENINSFLETIRQMMFSYKVRAFIFEDGSIIGITNYKKPYMFNYFLVYFISDMENDSLNDNFRELFEFLSKEKSIRLRVDERMDKKYKYVIQKCGFEKELVLKNELVDNQDVVQYVYK